MAEASRLTNTAFAAPASVVYDLRHAQGAATAREYAEFNGEALRTVLAKRFGSMTQQQVDGFALHTGKDKRTIFRYLSGELSIPRWAVFMAITLGHMSDAQVADVWDEARQRAVHSCSFP